MSRIFAFGCSMTSYHWPTWADIYAHGKANCDYYNYAAAGLGNVAIQTLILEADLRHKFNERDEIIITWSGWHRNDFYKNPIKWSRGYGSVLHLHPPYEETFLERYWSFENDYIKNYTSIIYVNRMYRDLISVQGALSEDIHIDDTIPNESIHRLYKPHMPSNIVNLPQNYWKNDYYKKFNDTHPEIPDHISYMKSLGLDAPKTTIEYFEKMHHDILNVSLGDKWKLQDYLENEYKFWDRGKTGHRI